MQNLFVDRVIKNINGRVPLYLQGNQSCSYKEKTLVHISSLQANLDIIFLINLAILLNPTSSRLLFCLSQAKPCTDLVVAPMHVFLPIFFSFPRTHALLTIQANHDVFPHVNVTFQCEYAFTCKLHFHLTCLHY